MSIGLYTVLAPLSLKSVRKLQEKRFVFIKILAIIAENAEKVSKIKCFGLISRHYLSGHVDANEEVMRMVADYIARNPDSNFASMAKKCGNRFVMVSSLGWG
ncbi:MAG: hypothetical protein MSS92_05920 [Lachnospiraceae bacterium]|nr:hypothetical protein [Lachnospiraceae bacterium]